MLPQFGHVRHVTLVLTLAASSTVGAEQSMEQPSPAGELKVIVAVSDSPESFEAWMTTPAESPARLRRNRDFSLGETAYIALIVTGFTPGPDGQMRVRADVEILKPDGSSLFVLKEYAGARGPMTTEPGFVMLDPALDLIFDDTDTPGTYRILATVTDQNTSVAVVGEETISLAARREEIPGEVLFESSEHLSQWMMTYYQKPDPERLISAVTYIAESPAFEKSDTRMPAAHFFASLLREDQNLLRALFEELSDGSSAEARLLGLHVFWLSNNQAGRALLSEAGARWASTDLTRLADQMKLKPPPDLLLDAIESPTDLDSLWSVFFATGSPKPIEKLVQAALLAETGQGFEKVLGATARWSLESNARQHARVREIMQGLRDHDDDVARRHLLESILRERLSTPLKLPPVDDAHHDASFLEFRESLLRTVAKRDSEGLILVLASDVISAFDGARGRKGFEDHWKPYQNDSEVWRILESSLSRGGTFRTPEVFCGPYVFATFPDELDPYDYAAILDERVPARSTPDVEAHVERELSHDLVRIVAKPDGGWIGVEMPGGGIGFVEMKHIGRPADFRACFRKQEGIWKLTVLVSGA